jgi:hypothetical protein
MPARWDIGYLFTAMNKYTTGASDQGAEETHLGRIHYVWTPSTRGIPECIVQRDICGMRTDAGAIRIIDDAYAVARANPKCLVYSWGPH